MELIIIKATPADLGEIAAIENASFTDPWSRAMLASDLTKENGFFLVAAADGAVCGYADGEDICGDFYVNNIAVAEAFRRRRIGEALLRSLIETAKSRRCQFISLEVRVTNLPARKLYEKYGFSLVGERRDYYTSPTENACIYTLYFPSEES